MMAAVHVTLCDVGPRDGLQNDQVTLPPATRAELCGRLAAAGLERVEAASFVHPRLVPQMAGAEEVFAGARADASDDVRRARAQRARGSSARWPRAPGRSTPPTA